MNEMDKINTRDEVAKKANVSPTTVHRVEKVLEDRDITLGLFIGKKLHGTITIEKGIKSVGKVYSFPPLPNKTSTKKFQ